MPSQHVHYHFAPGTQVCPSTYLKPPTPPTTHYHCTPCKRKHSPRPPHQHYNSHAPPTPNGSPSRHRVHRLSTLLTRLSHATYEKKTKNVSAEDEAYLRHKITRTMEKLLYKQYDYDFHHLPKPVYRESRDRLKAAIQRCLGEGFGGVGCMNLEKLWWAVEWFGKSQGTGMEVQKYY